MSNDPKIIVALDFPEAKSAMALVQRLDPALCRVKVGSELFTAAGASFIEEVIARGFGLFLDLKFHDIPNTVAAACRSAARLGVWMLNVHASGGKPMLEAAREAIPRREGAPKLIAVTLLTSMGPSDLEDIGVAGTTEQAVLRLAMLAKASALDGVVCSAREAAALRSACGAEFCLVTPGIRPADAAAHDQRRIMTPSGALANGSSYLVIGRPITCAPDPLTALSAIHAEIAGGARGPT